MTSILYLTAQEKGLFDALPEGVRSSWKGAIEAEKSTAFETPEDIARRVEIVREGLSPTDKLALTALMDRMNADGIDALDEDSVPPHLFTKVLLVIGASGLSVFLQETISSAADAEDLQAAADISDSRHQILMTNSAVASV